MTASIERSDDFVAKDMSCLLWSFAFSGLAQSQALLFESMAPNIVILLDQCNGPNLARIAWSYSVANVNSEVLFDSLFTEAILDTVDQFNSGDICQLYQWHLGHKVELLCHKSALPQAVE